MERYVETHPPVLRTAPKAVALLSVVTAIAAYLFMAVARYPALSVIEGNSRLVHRGMSFFETVMRLNAGFFGLVATLLGVSLCLGIAAFFLKHRGGIKMVYTLLTICQCMVIGVAFYVLFAYRGLDRGLDAIIISMNGKAGLTGGAYLILILSVIAAVIPMMTLISVLINEGRISTKIYDRIFIVCNTIFMLFVIVVMLYPFLNQLAISLNNATDSIKGGIYLWPRYFTLHNYRTIFDNPRLITAFSNSILRTLISTVGGLFMCAMAGYILSRKEFVLRKAVTIFFLLTMYVSPGLIPTFFLYRDLGLVNSFHVYWVPGLFGAFNVIVIRTYMQGLPDSLTEAARIDGAGEFRTFAQIILPICKPVLATVGLWISVGNWNDWFTTFIYASGNPRLTTLQYELMGYLSAAMAQMGSRQAEHIAAQGASAFENITPIAIRSTITIVAAVPILCVYPFLQKYFVKGVHVGSVKG
jgi:putative aldouronate transport system permease protein